MINNDKILLITTTNCAACKIAEDNIKTAINSYTGKSIAFEIQSFRSIPKDFLKENRITDYPTVIYYRNKKIQCKVTGSYPFPVYVRWIDMYFK